MRQLLRFLPHLAMLAFAAWCVFALRGDLAHLSAGALLGSWDLLGLAMLLSIANYGLRILRWRYFLVRLGHRLPFRFSALAFTAGFAYTLSPGKLGEIMRARYYAPLGVPLSDVTAAFFAERLMDLVAMIVLAALLVTTFTQFHGALFGAAALVVVALGVLTLAPWDEAAAAARAAPRLAPLLRAVLVSGTSALAATRPLLKPGILVRGFAIGLAAWGLEGVGLGIIGGMFPSVHLSMVTAIGVYGVAVLVGGLSFLPGGLGSTEAVMTMLLVASGCTLGQGMVLTLACRLLTLWFAVGLGWIAVILLRPKRVAAMQP